ncbi:hypothetical protein SAMN04488112_11454 [Melghirimyces thermohalophilus]|uniref:Uncharacterized protein n=1 Tax=Melghirimyces thermohalophilus TaxID=1236220 RepID=A0A1G6NWZ6_9BACL|nr:hypothetical protein SAMN04488112_11454 [Melghirimyces thermohalophilus]
MRYDFIWTKGEDLIWNNTFDLKPIHRIHIGASRSRWETPVPLFSNSTG